MADLTIPDRPKARSLKPLRALWPYLRPYRGTILLALLALLTASAAMLALPVALRYLIDEGMTTGSSETVNRYFIAFLAAAGAFGVFAALRFYLVTWLGERVIADLRSDVYSRVIRMDLTFFEVTRTGEVLSRLTADTTLVQSIAGVNLSITLRSTITIAGSLVMLAITSLKLTGLILVLIPLIIGPLVTLGRQVRRLSRTSQDRIARDRASDLDQRIYAVGLRSLYDLSHGSTDWQLYDEVLHTAVEQRSLDRTDDFTRLRLGATARRPFGVVGEGRRADYLFYAFADLFPDLPDSLVNGEQDGHGGEAQFEFGVTFGATEPLRWWRIPLPRIGLGYRFGDDLSVYRLVFGTPF